VRYGGGKGAVDDAAAGVEGGDRGSGVMAFEVTVSFTLLANQ
jgi:hypothetical protein